MKLNQQKELITDTKPQTLRDTRNKQKIMKAKLRSFLLNVPLRHWCRLRDVIKVDDIEVTKLLSLRLARND